MNKNLNENIVELKISNGHQIWICKKLINGIAGQLKPTRKK